jgi:cytoskeletal protein CcmA (bactofilin family)
MAMFEKRSPANPLSALQPAAPQRLPQPVATAPPPPQFLRESEVRTSIGPDAVINGKLSFTTPTRVEGKLKGELRCTQLLIIGATAVVEGCVRADELRIEGVVHGEVVDTRKVEVCDKGRLIGRVTSRLLVIRDGAFFEGECAVGPDAHFAEQLGMGTEAASP